MDKTLNGLLHSRKFMLASFGLLQTILFQFVPDFPPSVWQAIDALVVVLIAAIAHEDAAEKSAPYPAGTFGIGGTPIDYDEYEAACADDSDLYEQQPVTPLEQPAVGFHVKTTNLPY